MAKALGGLMNRLARRRVRQEASQADEPPVALDTTASEDAPLELHPVLMPAAIIRQLLFDATEFTPAWARPRQAPVLDAAPVTPTDEQKPAKRARRPKPTTSPATSRPRARASRATKPKDAADT